MNKHKNSYKIIKLFEAFAGVGSQRIALNEIAKIKNWKIESVGIIEWYLDAIIAYELFHNNKHINDNSIVQTNKIISKDSKNPVKNIHQYDNTRYAGFINNSLKYSHNLFNIMEVNGNQVPKNIDIFTYSFPCQDLSIQGKQKGMDKMAKTRSGLVWEILRILQEMKKINTPQEMPKYLILENVKSLSNQNHLPQFKKFISELEKLGYKTTYSLLNASHYGSSQNRERFFAVSVRNDLNDYQFENIKNASIKQKVLNDILDKTFVVDKFINKLEKLSRTKWSKSKNNIITSNIENYTTFHSENIVYRYDGIGPTLTASGANSRIKVIDKNNKLRFLSAKECYRYMGFKNQYYQKLEKESLITNNKAIYMAGNSISIELLKVIFNQINL